MLPISTRVKVKNPLAATQGMGVIVGYNTIGVPEALYLTMTPGAREILYPTYRINAFVNSFTNRPKRFYIVDFDGSKYEFDEEDLIVI